MQEHFFRKKTLAGKKVLISAGPTHEAIDPVRFIANHSSGKMGYALAEAFYNEGADVTLVSGPTNMLLKNQGIKLIKVTSAEEMFEACTSVFAAMDIAVMAAAVADYKPAVTAKQKIKKTEDRFVLTLTKTKDILKKLGELKNERQVLVGFALETNDEKQNALHKLQTKNADMIVLNSMQDANATFGYDTNKVTVFDKEGNVFESELASKQKIAEYIVEIIIKKYYDKA